MSINTPWVNSFYGPKQQEISENISLLVQL